MTTPNIDTDAAVNTNEISSKNTVTSSNAVDIYSFKNSDQQKLFSKIIQELRCSVCQNQNLADSNAPLAIDLRNQIYSKVKEQKSEQQIIEFVSSRYGDFVLYRPPLQWDTAILWFSPVLMLVVGFLVLRNLFRQPRQPQH